MYLVRLIYCSTPNVEVNKQIIDDIVNVSIENNKKMSITGVLCFDDKYFLQWVEGPRSSINDLYCRLIKDDRHKELVLLDYSPISSRNFPHWSMTSICAKSIKEATLLKYVYENDYNPYTFSADAAKTFFIEVCSELCR